MDPDWAYVFIFFGLMSLVATTLYFWPAECYFMYKKIKSYFSK